MAQLIPNDSVFNVATFDIFSEGEKLPATLEVLSIVITKEINRIPTARIIIRDGDPATNSFRESDKDQFLPGKKIKIALGRDRNNESVFTGLVTKHNVQVKRGHPRLVVECKDESFRMTIGRRSTYFEDKTDTQVIEEIIGKYGNLKRGTIASTRIKHPHLVQYHTTDWDFMLSRADVNSLLVIADDGTITAEKPKTSAAPALSLTYGATIFELDAEIDGRTQFENIESRAWDYANQQLFKADTNRTNVQEAGNVKGSKISADTIQLDKLELQHSGNVIEQELQNWVDACMQRSRLAKIRGKVSIIEGVALIKPGQMLALKGISERFNGNVFVAAVRQEYVEGKWDTHIQFGLSPEWFAKEPNIMDMPAAGLLPGVNGLQIGKVVKLQDDPAGEDRIQVKLPMVDPSAAGTWARVASLDAGQNRGAFFRPELDDEVIVGFINDDPRDPIVLGMLNSSAKPAPIVAQDANHEKGFVTRDELKLLFHDEDKSITITTPAGNSIKIDESTKSIEIIDQNNNKFIMNQSGIEIDSPKAINIKAGTSINIEASSNINVKGTSVKIEASAQLEGKGALTKISASGITELKGSLVKIN